MFTNKHAYIIPLKQRNFRKQLITIATVFIIKLLLLSADIFYNM